MTDDDRTVMLSVTEREENTILIGLLQRRDEANKLASSSIQSSNAVHAGYWREQASNADRLFQRLARVEDDD